MAEHSTTDRSIADFAEMDEAGKISAFRSAVNERDSLKQQISDLQAQLTASKESQGHGEARRPSTQADNPYLQATHDLVCGLSAPVIERLDRLEIRSPPPSQASSPVYVSDESDVESAQSASAEKKSKPSKHATFTDEPKDTPRSSTRNVCSVAVNAVPQLSSDVLGWIHQTDFWFRTYDVHSDVAIPLIVSKLPQKDFAWIRYHVNASKISSWDDMKAAFRKRYGLGDKFNADEHNEHEQRAQMILAATQSDGESCTDFAFRKLELVDECDYPTTQKDKCEAIIGSLLPHVKKYFFDKEFASLDNLLESFLRFDSLIASHKPKDSEKYKKFARNKAEAAFNVSHTSDPLDAAPRHPGRNAGIPSKSGENLQTAPVKPARSPQPGSRRGRRGSTKSPGTTRNHPEVQRLCLNCKEAGHFASRCPMPLTKAFLEWQERFLASTPPRSSGNECLMPSTPARRDQQ